MLQVRVPMPWKLRYLRQQLALVNCQHQRCVSNSHSFTALSTPLSLQSQQQVIFSQLLHHCCCTLGLALKASQSKQAWLPPAGWYRLRGCNSTTRNPATLAQLCRFSSLHACSLCLWGQRAPCWIAALTCAWGPLSPPGRPPPQRSATFVAGASPVSRPVRPTPPPEPAGQQRSGEDAASKGAPANPPSQHVAGGAAQQGGAQPTGRTPADALHPRPAPGSPPAGSRQRAKDTLRAATTEATLAGGGDVALSQVPLAARMAPQLSSEASRRGGGVMDDGEPVLSQVPIAARIAAQQQAGKAKRPRHVSKISRLARQAAAGRAESTSPIRPSGGSRSPSPSPVRDDPGPQPELMSARMVAGSEAGSVPPVISLPDLAVDAPAAESPTPAGFALAHEGSERPPPQTAHKAYSAAKAGPSPGTTSRGERRSAEPQVAGPDCASRCTAARARSVDLDADLCFVQLSQLPLAARVSQRSGAAATGTWGQQEHQPESAARPSHGTGAAVGLSNEQPLETPSAGATGAVSPPFQSVSLGHVRTALGEGSLWRELAPEAPLGSPQAGCASPALDQDCSLIIPDTPASPAPGGKWHEARDSTPVAMGNLRESDEAKLATRQQFGSQPGGSGGEEPSSVPVEDVPLAMRKWARLEGSISGAPPISCMTL